MTTTEINQYFIAIDGINIFSYSPIKIAKIEVENDQAEEIFRTVFFLSPETINQNLYQN